MSLKRATIAFATLFGLALIVSFAPDPAAAFTAAQKAACGGDAQRLCSSSMSDPQQLTACMQSNQSKVSSRCRAAMGGGGAGAEDEALDVAGVKLVAREVAGLDKDGLRALVDKHRDRIKSGVVVLASPSDGKVSIVVGVTPDLTKKVPAGQVVKQLAPIVGGGGGGRPDFAEAGGKDASKIQDLLSASRLVIEKLLSS